MFRATFVALLLAGVGLVVDVASDVAGGGSVIASASGVPVAPRVVSAVAGDGFVQITIADMSPDSGVYAVQWVPYGRDFNSYQMYRATTKTMTVPYLSCSRSHTLRVFVMSGNWQLADGHQTQNVTPHSTTFDLTMPACVSTTATVTALTCATGGTCVVGDTGPGGGKVFYVRAAGGTFTSTDSDCNTACKYLEAAPSDQSAGIVWATNASFCYADGSDTGDQDCQLNSIYSNTAGQAASRTASTAIGMGMANTNQIYARLTTVGSVTTTSYAAGIAWAYTNNGKTDWYLPSKDELNQMCKWQGGLAWTSDETVCEQPALNSGSGASGFSDNFYWSSSESAANRAWYQKFDLGTQSINTKNKSYVVRPVRAFG